MLLNKIHKNSIHIKYKKFSVIILIMILQTILLIIFHKEVGVGLVTDHSLEILSKSANVKSRLE